MGTGSCRNVSAQRLALGSSPLDASPRPLYRVPMEFAPFHSLFLEVAEDDLLRIEIRPGDPLPKGEYAFLEHYCMDAGCDCRLVMLQVVSLKHPKKVLATVQYGWAPLKHYKAQFGDAAAKEAKGPSLVVGAPQSRQADLWLEIVTEVLREKPVAAQLRTHYRMWREAVNRAGDLPDLLSHFEPDDARELAEQLLRFAQSPPPLAAREPLPGTDLPEPDAFYAYALGPIETGEGSVQAYMAGSRAFALPPILGGKPAEALRALQAQTGGAPLYVEPALAAAARAAKLATASPPDWALTMRAHLATRLALAGLGENLTAELIDEFLPALTAFCHAEPWRYWPDRFPLRVTVDAPRAERFEGSIMGAAGLEYGLALYRKPGAVARIHTLAAQGQADKARELADGIAITFDAEPAWAARAVGDRFGFDRIPLPYALRKGQMLPVRASEAAVLAACLHACALLSPGRLEATAEIVFEGKPVHVTVVAPPVAH